MIDKITEFIWNNIHEYDGHTYSWFAEKLLKEIEDAGMTPPVYEKKLTEEDIQDYLFKFGVPCDDKYVLYLTEWEEEND